METELIVLSVLMIAAGIIGLLAAFIQCQLLQELEEADDYRRAGRSGEAAERAGEPLPVPRDR